MVHHRRQGSGLAAAGGPDHQHQPVFLHHQVLQDLRQGQAFNGGYLTVHVAENQGHFAALAKCIGAEAAHLLDADAEIHLTVFLEIPDLGVGGQGAEYPLHVTRLQLISHPGETAGTLEQDLGACVQVHVLTALGHHDRQVGRYFEIGYCHQSLLLEPFVRMPRAAPNGYCITSGHRA